MEQAYRKMAERPPRWVQVAFTIRDRLCAMVGLSTVEGFGPLGPLVVGGPAHFFTVQALSQDNLRLTADDSHLTVQLEMMRSGTQLQVETSVVTHNLIGRIYMLPVGLAHPVVSRTMLRRIAM